MNQSKGNVVYLQSGGPTAVINTSFLGLYETFLKEKREDVFYVSRYGISSLLNQSLEKVESSLSYLRYEPGAHFGSIRKMLPDDLDDPIGKEVIEILKEYQIRYVYCNGGNDSMDTAFKIDSYCKKYDYECHVIGVPKTIDNDLFGCDHTPGFGTAAKFVANALIAATYDEYSYKKGKIFILETMGRDAGFVAASAILASLRNMAPDYIYVPEVDFDVDLFMEKAIRTYEEKGHCIIVVSEGIKDKNRQLIASTRKSKDVFGNTLVGGVSSYLCSLFAQKGYPARYLELSVLNRASSFMLSKCDSDEAYEVGKEAYYTSLEDSGKMITIERVSSNPYQAKYGKIDLKDCRKSASSLPLCYINEEGDNILESYLDFVKPLIEGNVDSLKEDGLLY